MQCRHIPRLHDYLWVAEDGMKMQGYNGSHLWDTAFAVQAIAASGLAADFQRCMQRAHSYLDTTQVRFACWLCHGAVCISFPEDSNCHTASPIQVSAAPGLAPGLQTSSAACQQRTAT